MTHSLTPVIYTAILTFVALMAASLIRAKGWTVPGMVIAMGNRDNVPAPNAFAARADRAAKNTIEGLPDWGVFQTVGFRWEDSEGIFKLLIRKIILSEHVDMRP